MRCMVFVKANKDSEAGILPSTEILTSMGKFNEELVKAGVMLAGEGLRPSSARQARHLHCGQAHHHRRPLRRNERTRRRLLDLAGPLH